MLVRPQLPRSCLLEWNISSGMQTVSLWTYTCHLQEAHCTCTHRMGGGGWLCYPEHLPRSRSWCWFEVRSTIILTELYVLPLSNFGSDQGLYVLYRSASEPLVACALGIVVGIVVAVALAAALALWTWRFQRRRKVATDSEAGGQVRRTCRMTAAAGRQNGPFPV